MEDLRRVSAKGSPKQVSAKELETLKPGKAVYLKRGEVFFKVSPQAAVRAPRPRTSVAHRAVPSSPP